MSEQKLFRLLRRFCLPVRARNPRAYALYFAAIIVALFFAFQKAQTETPKSSEQWTTDSEQRTVDSEQVNDGIADQVRNDAERRGG